MTTEDNMETLGANSENSKKRYLLLFNIITMYIIYFNSE